MPEDFARAIEHDLIDERQLLALFREYRDKVKHEDSLINWRTTWFIAAQSVLFLSVSMLAGNLGGTQLKVLCSAFAGTGFALSLLTLVSIRAAQISIRDHVDQWDAITKYRDKAMLPRLAGSAPGKGLILKGGILSICMPLAVSIVWVFIVSAIYIYETPMSEMERLMETWRQSIEEMQAESLTPQLFSPPVSVDAAP